MDSTEEGTYMETNAAVKFWKRTEEKVIFPEDLKKDPDKFGGPSLHMAISIVKGIVTVPISNECWHVSLPVSFIDAKRICNDGGVDISTKKHWCSIHNADVYFSGTLDKVELIRGLF